MIENFSRIYNFNQLDMLGKWVEKLKSPDNSDSYSKFDVEKDLDTPITFETKNALTPLSEQSKAELKEKGYPDTVIENIGSEEEKNIYENADLTPKEVNGRYVLVKSDIDLNLEDDFGRTNLDRMKQGLAPLDRNGNPIELHHVGQKMDSPLAELTRDEHRGKGNDTVLHNKQKESEINREDFAKERAEYWKARGEQLESQTNA